MDKNIQLELYTRPTCSDCQESKRYLNSQEISYSHKDVSQNLDLEEEMKKYQATELFPYLFFIKKIFGVKKSCLNITWDLKITKKIY